MSDLYGILLTVFLLLLNAFFVGAEFSLIAARKDRLEALIGQGKRRAKVVLEASEHLSMMLAAAQLGITIASLLLGKVSEPAFAHLLEQPFHAWGVPDAWLHPISFAIALLFVSVLHIMLGEMVPKNISLAGPETTAMWLIPLHMKFYKLTRPLLLFFNWIARHTLRLFGMEQKDELDSTVNSEELASMIAESRQEGLLDSEEHVRLSRALASADRTIREVLIPMDKVRRIPAHPTVGDLEEAVAATGFSRFPVNATTDGATQSDSAAQSTGTNSENAGQSRGRSQEVVHGYVHVKDVLDRVIDSDTGPETAIPDDEIRELITVKATATLDAALRIMRRKSAHMAVVIDPEHKGGQIGIIALEDLIEEHVGVVRDWTHEVNPKTAAALEAGAKRSAKTTRATGARTSAEAATAKAMQAKTMAVAAMAKASAKNSAAKPSKPTKQNNPNPGSTNNMGI